MVEYLKIKRALISVSNKAGLINFAEGLSKHNIQLISTGGTSQTLRKAGIANLNVSQLTGFPEIMDGRVKTLHPKIHGAILAKRNHPKHLAEMEAHNIKPIDLVIVNLYPFQDVLEEHLQGLKSSDDCIENIDIGGPAMIRAAAKNMNDVAVVTDPVEYADVLKELDENDGSISLDLRKLLSAQAYGRTSAYDLLITNWLLQSKNSIPKRINLSGKLIKSLRYGENPDQEAGFYQLKNLFSTSKNAGQEKYGVAYSQLLQGKDLSYNNIIDSDMAFKLVCEFNKKNPHCVIVKHAIPCGAAYGKNITESWKKALKSDPVSAFGGIVAFNAEIDEQCANALKNMFLEVIIAPAFSIDACEILKSKKNLRLIKCDLLNQQPYWQHKTVSGGLLMQTLNHSIGNPKNWTQPSKQKASKDILDEASFAMNIVKYAHSNAIVLSANHQVLGIGAGQTSRVDAVQIAIQKMQNNHPNDQKKQLVAASDGFFPFPDAVSYLIDAGVTTIVQPGGSQNDQKIIELADQKNICMILTNRRLFSH
ncbi:MAG: bifunctional phosphoribosylaminoimidazolecarboxamide formyltransferase/IMP cyclohydrolase [Pseudomonadota bacterium]